MLRVVVSANPRSANCFSATAKILARVAFLVSAVTRITLDLFYEHAHILACLLSVSSRKLSMLILSSELACYTRRSQEENLLEIVPAVVIDSGPQNYTNEQIRLLRSGCARLALPVPAGD